MTDHYVDMLKRCASHIREAGFSASVRGEGVQAFVFAEAGPRGFELYCGEESGAAVIDPAYGDALLGEVEYPSYRLAARAGLRWLAEGIQPVSADPTSDPNPE